MKKLIQIVVGGVAMCAVAHLTWETPFHHWMVFTPIFIGTMYGVAVLQAYAHWRFSRRGAATTTPGASVNGTPRAPAGI